MSPAKKICMKCWNHRRQFAWSVTAYFLGKITKNISKCYLLKILPSMLAAQSLPYLSLTFTTLWAFSADDKLMISSFSYFPPPPPPPPPSKKKQQKFTFQNTKSCLLGKIRKMKCQILFSGKNKKNISKCRLLKILPRVLSIKFEQAHFTMYAKLLGERQIM